MAPRVLVSDELSETAVQIFRDRGVEVDFQPQVGKDKDKLAEIIGNYDGLAIRSATKVTEKIIASATNLKVVGRAGIGVDNVDIPAASRRGIIVMNTPFGNSITTPASGKSRSSWAWKSPARRLASSVPATSARSSAPAPSG
jgi:D-3-phosphoglycerate dehydrogenase